MKILSTDKALHAEIHKLKSIMLEMSQTLSLVDDDICEHLHVATSLEVRNRIRIVQKLYRSTLTEEDIRLQEMDKLK